MTLRHSSRVRFVQIRNCAMKTVAMGELVLVPANDVLAFDGEDDSQELSEALVDVHHDHEVAIPPSTGVFVRQLLLEGGDLLFCLCWCDTNTACQS